MIATERLQIIPLKPFELELYLEEGGRLEKLFHLKETGRMISDEVRKRVSRNILPKLREMKGMDYLFLTFWIVVEKSTSAIVAELGFKGVPDEKGGVEIGYGTLPSQRRKGIMTEAVGGMIQWTKSRPDIHFILAETDVNNQASVRVMEKNNFKRAGLKGSMQWWKLNVSEL